MRTACFEFLPDVGCRTSGSRVCSKGATTRWGPEVVFPECTDGDDVAAPQFVTAEGLALAGLMCISADPDGALAGREAFEESFMKMDDASRARVLGTMMADGGDATNGLGSWLADGRPALAFLPPDLQATFSSRHLTALALESGVAIKNGEGDETCWMNLALVLGHRPPAGRIVAALEECVRVADFVGLVKSPRLASIVVNAVGLHAARLSGDCRTVIVGKLVELAGMLADVDMEERERDELLRSMLGAMVGCTWCEGDGRGHALAGALERVFGVYRGRALERPALDLVLRMCSALPVEQARHFWRVRDILRERTTLVNQAGRYASPGAGA